MKTQKNRWQAYSAALHNDLCASRNELCSLRDAVELVHEKHSAVRAIRLSFGNHAQEEMAKAELGLKNAVDDSVKIARGEQ